MNKQIFITVGTTKFDKLCNAILKLEFIQLLKSLGYKKLIVQVGNSDYPHIKECGIQIEIYKFKDSILDDIKNSDLVISHAGAGTCLEVLEIGKPLLVVINTELMNNHQIEIAEQLQTDGHLYHCTCDTLYSILQKSEFSKLKPYPRADATPLFDHLDKMFEFI